jgi:hypothetical protein
MRLVFLDTFSSGIFNELAQIVLVPDEKQAVQPGLYEAQNIAGRDDMTGHIASRSLFCIGYLAKGLARICIRDHGDDLQCIWSQASSILRTLTLQLGQI